MNSSAAKLDFMEALLKNPNREQGLETKRDITMFDPNLIGVPPPFNGGSSSQQTRGDCTGSIGVTRLTGHKS